MADVDDHLPAAKKRAVGKKTVKNGLPRMTETSIHPFGSSLSCVDETL